MEGATATLLSNGGWLGVMCVLLLTALGGVWLKYQGSLDAREALRDRREEDLKTLITTMNASARANEELADAVKALQASIVELGKIAAARSGVIEEFNRTAQAILARVRA